MNKVNPFPALIAPFPHIFFQIYLLDFLPKLANQEPKGPPD